MTQPSINRLIKEAKNIVVSEAAAARDRGDHVAKITWGLRSDHLRALSREFDVLSKGRLPNTVFVSYSVNSGAAYFAYVEDLLKKSKFKVVTGFQRQEGDQDNVLKRVRSQLERSTLYLAILSKELEVKSYNSDIRWAPSVWTIEEKGMALALQKPFVLMVEEGIHEDFWRKTAPDRVHHMFNRTNYMAVAAAARDALAERYGELTLKGTTLA